MSTVSIEVIARFEQRQGEEDTVMLASAVTVSIAMGGAGTDATLKNSGRGINGW